MQMINSAKKQLLAFVLFRGTDRVKSTAYVCQRQPVLCQGEYLLKPAIDQPQPDGKRHLFHRGSAREKGVEMGRKKVMPSPKIFRGLIYTQLSSDA